MLSVPSTHLGLALLAIRNCIAQAIRMNRFLIVVALITAASFACAENSEEAQPLSGCEVIARINSEVILACELEWQVKLMFSQRFGPEAVALADDPRLQEARREMLKNLVLARIDISLLYADFRSNAPQADMASIEEQLREPFEKSEVPRLMESMGVEDQHALEMKLKELGTSLAERRQDFIRTMIARTWMTQSTKYDKEVTHEQMLDYYHEHEQEYDQPLRARWEELMVRFDNYPTKKDAWAAIARLGNDAHAAIAATPIDEPAFAEIAPTKSEGFTAADGGIHDWTKQGSLASAAVDQALFSLPAGEMSPILEGPIGFHIVRVIERKEAGPTPFSEVQADIRKGLQDERFQVAIDKKLNGLKRSARLWTVFTGDLNYEELAALQGGPTTTK